MKTNPQTALALMLLAQSSLVSGVFAEQSNKLFRLVRPMNFIQCVGESTNCIRGLIQVYTKDVDMLPPIDVWVNWHVTTNPVPENGRTNRDPAFYFGEAYDGQLNRPAFFAPPNGLCGVLDVRDSGGKPVRMLGGATNQLGQFPKEFSRRQVEGEHMARYRFYSGPPVPMPLLTDMPRLASFQPDEVFQIVAEGHYKLTVWPVIYQCSATNNDLCKRIEVLPVTVDLEFAKVPPSSSDINTPPQK